MNKEFVAIELVKAWASQPTAPVKFSNFIENYNYALDKFNCIKETQLQQRIDKAEECIMNFLCSEEYCGLDGIAIAKNYEELLEILRGIDEK